MIAGLIFLLAFALEKSSIGALVRPAALAVILMIALTFVSQHFVTGRMADLRREMGSVDTTPHGNPLRVQFDKLHVVSVRIESAVLLLGLAGLFLTIRGFSSQHH